MSPKWMSLVPAAEDSADETGPGAAELGDVESGVGCLGTRAQQKRILARAMGAIWPISPFVLVADGQARAVKPEEQVAPVNEGLAEAVEMERPNMANGMHNGPPEGLEGRGGRKRRSGAPSPESMALQKESKSASAWTFREQFSETGTEIQTPMVHTPAAMDTDGMGYKSSTPRGGAESAPKPTLGGVEKIDGVSIVIHCEGEQDLILEFGLTGLARRG